MGDPSSSATHATSVLLLQDAGLTGSAVVGLGWGMHAGACWGMHAGACMLGHACWGIAMADDRHGWPLTMTVALPQQANLPRSRACQRECQSVRGWLGTASGCGPRLALCSNSSAAGRLEPRRAVRRVARVAASGSRPAGAGRGQLLTLQLPSCSPTASGSRKGSGPVRSGRSGLVRICPVGVPATGQTACQFFFRSGFAGTGRPGCPASGE